ncbi:hypothetical protein WCD74_29705 [Actinomycetospora sp. OC33-EN08]|uniref:Uncharacterized protein n=1 Tax=Actinomycetospora aurantiaca TaxID=3129233 RepID=A0ABU8MXA9_9PSEU
MIDVELLADTGPAHVPGAVAHALDEKAFEGVLSAQTLLASLLADSAFKVLRYADDGPPYRDIVSSKSGPHAPGWVMSPPDHAVEGETGEVVYSFSTGHVVLAARSQHALVFVEQDERADPRSGPDDRTELERQRAVRRADYLAGQSAEAVDADVFITRRTYLLNHAHRFARGVDCMTPEQALTVVGLFLRCRGQFLLAATWDGGRYEVDRGLFYWIGTRALLPASWRYFAGCIRADRPEIGASTLYLAQSTLRRLDRALRQRDLIHWSLNKPQRNDTAEDASAALDNVLQLLVGALDAAARVAHIVAGMPTETLHRVGWQKQQWRDGLREAFPDLVGFFAPGTPGEQLFLLLRLLRNSVHGEALQASVVHDAARGSSVGIGLPAMSIASLLSVMDNLGGEEVWGVTIDGAGQAYVDPGIMVDQLVPLTAALLDNVMAHTPVEQVIGESVTAHSKESSEHDDVLSEANETRVVLQLGLDPRTNDLRGP